MKAWLVFLIKTTFFPPLLTSLRMGTRVPSGWYKALRVLSVLTWRFSFLFLGGGSEGG